MSASAIILVHSHPGDDPASARSDIDLTRGIEGALARLDIKAHDHLVVGASEPVSMKAKGLLRDLRDRLHIVACCFGSHR